MLRSTPAGILLNDILGVPNFKLALILKACWPFPNETNQHVCIISDPVNQIRRYTALS